MIAPIEDGSFDGFLATKFSIWCHYLSLVRKQFVALKRWRNLSIRDWYFSFVCFEAQMRLMK